MVRPVRETIRKGEPTITRDDRALIFTDGGCWPNPGPGGWGVVAQFGDRYRELHGGSNRTTSNEMELTAIDAGLTFLTSEWRASRIVIRTDSRYAISCLTRWHHVWRRSGWITATSGSPVKNKDLIERITSLIDERRLTCRFEWVRGHSGIALNERADELASMYFRSTRRH